LLDRNRLSSRRPTRCSNDISTRWAVYAIKNVLSETRHGEVEATGMKGKSTYVSYAKPFKSLFKVTRPDGHKIISGFDRRVSWSVTPQGATIDKTLRSKRCAGMPTFNMRFINRTISGGSNSPESPILRAGSVIGFTVRLTGARTTISSTMSKPGCSPATVFNRMSHRLR
jgi:hypothetical protein